MFEGFSKAFVREAIHRSSENAVDRRRFLRAAGLTGLGVAGVAGGGLALSGSAFASDDSHNGAVTDAAILNFALNLEYLEAEFYLRSAPELPYLDPLPADVLSIDPPGEVLVTQLLPALPEVAATG